MIIHLEKPSIIRGRFFHEERGPYPCIRYRRTFGLWRWVCTRPSLVGIKSRGPFLSHRSMKLAMMAQEREIADHYRVLAKKAADHIGAELEKLGY